MRRIDEENVIQKKSFDFALDIIRLCQQLRKKREFVIAGQLMESGTSIGANVVEAAAAQSRKDFVSKMAIVSKEARETKYWLMLVQKSALAGVKVDEELAEVEELIRILTAIVKTTGRTSQ